MKRINIQTEEKGGFAFQEAIRTLRTNIQFSGANVRHILLTSTAPAEGKSTLSFDLAMSIAESGKKVCLVDADVRRSVFCQRHGIQGETVGLTQILSGQVSVEDAVYETNIPNLFIIFTGPFSPSSTELFEDPTCGALFHKLDAMGFERIVIDTPPLGSVIDAAILAKYADGIVLVAESGVTRKKVLRRVKEQIDKTGVRLLGVVLNRVETGKGGYYSSYYGYGYYGNYYGNER